MIFALVGGGAFRNLGSVSASSSRLTAGLYVPRIDWIVLFSRPLRRSNAHHRPLCEIIIRYSMHLRPWQAFVRSTRSA